MRSFKADVSRVSLSKVSSNSLWRRADARNVSFETLYGDQFTLSTQLMILNYPVSLLAQFTILNYPVSVGRINLRSCKWKSSVTYWFKVELKQSQSTSDSQVKVALSANHFCHWFYFRAFFSFQGLVTGDVVWMIMEMLQILSKQNRFENYTLIGPSRCPTVSIT